MNDNGQKRQYQQHLCQLQHTAAPNTLIFCVWLCERDKRGIKKINRKLNNKYRRYQTIFVICFCAVILELVQQYRNFPINSANNLIIKKSINMERLNQSLKEK